MLAYVTANSSYCQILDLVGKSYLVPGIPSCCWQILAHVKVG